MLFRSGSMKIINRAEGLIELKIILNKEFEALLLSFGDQVEVIEPLWFRDKIREKVMELLKIYSTCADQVHTWH